MKRMLQLVLVAALALSVTGLASAAELKVKGEYRADFSWTDNTNFKDNDGDDGDGNSEDDFEARQRMRVRFAYVASETLQAVLHLEMGDSVWGRPNDGADLGADDRVIEVKNAYLDFNLPNTEVNVKVGVQDVSLPWSGYFEGSHILADDAAAVIVSAPINNLVGVTAGWSRLWDTQRGNGGNNNNFDEADVFFLALPITPEGMKIVPYGAFAQVGKDAAAVNASGDRLSALTGLWQFTNIPGSLGDAVADGESQTTAWWAGLAFELTMFDPFVFYFDFVYGSWEQDDVDATLPAVPGILPATTLDNLETKGFIVDFAMKYKGFSFVTPEIFFAYGSGNDSDALEDGALGTVPFVFDDSWTPTGVSFWGGTDFGGNQMDLAGQNLPGHWTVGVALRGFSFVDKLTHDLIVSYIRGTNSRDFVEDAIDRGLLDNESTGYGFNRLGAVMSTKDAVWTVDFNHTYEIYEQLTAHLELSWWNPDFDEEVWDGSVNAGFADDLESAWKVLLGVRYKF